MAEQLQKRLQRLEPSLNQNNDLEVKEILQQSKQKEFPISKRVLNKLLLKIANKRPNARLEKTAKLLLEAGADPNCFSTVGYKTPLIAAITNSNVGLIRLLLENGADPKAHGLLDSVLKNIIFGLMSSKGKEIFDLVVERTGEIEILEFMRKNPRFIQMFRGNKNIDNLFQLERKHLLGQARRVYQKRPGTVGMQNVAMAGGGGGAVQQQVVRQTIRGNLPDDLMQQLSRLLYTVSLQKNKPQGKR